MDVEQQRRSRWTLRAVGATVSEFHSAAVGYPHDCTERDAYFHDCQGNQEGVDASYAIYEQIEQDNPGIPSCPYCD